MRRLAALCLVLCGCARKHAPPPAADAAPAAPREVAEAPLARTRVVEVTAEDVTPAEVREFTLDLATIKQSAEKTLAASAAFEPATSQLGVPHRLKLEVGSQVGREHEGTKGPAVVHVLIEATLSVVGDADAAPRSARGVIEREFELADHDAVQKKLASDLTRAIADTVGDLVAEERMRSGDLAEVEAALGGPDPERNKLAIRYAGERHARALVPRLIQLLQSPDPEVRDSAIGALVTLGDRRAVKPLTDLVQFRDVDSMRRIIDAVATLGGDDARSYLELVASAHEDVRIKALAEEALKRMGAEPPEPPEKPKP